MADYSQYIAVKKIEVAQTANANTSIVKSRAPNMYNGYFPLYSGIRLPANALIPNKLIPTPPASIDPNLPIPPQISGLSMWLDATDPLADGSIVANNTNITTWVDKSGGGKNAVSQTTSAILKTNILNSKSVIRFVGQSSYKVTYPAFPNAGCTIFVVMQTSVNDQGYRTAIFGPYGGNYGLRIGLATDGSNISTSVGNTTSAWNDQSTNSPSVSIFNAFKIVSFVNTANVLSPYVNGVAQTTKNGTTTSFNDLAIANGTGAWVGDIAEIIVYNRALTSERPVVETYLSNKWNVK